MLPGPGGERSGKQEGGWKHGMDNASSGVHCGNGLDLFKSPQMVLNLPHENLSALRAGSEFSQAPALLSQKSILVTVHQTLPFPADG